jgi:hypothetical protein
MSYKILDENGNPLDEKYYTIHEKDKHFLSHISNVTLDFRGCYAWTFYISSDMIIYCGDNCDINRAEGEYNTIIKPGKNCSFIFKQTFFRKRINITTRYVYNLYNTFRKRTIKDKNEALLNMKHDDEWVRGCCEKIMRGEI